jgi:tetratricopeptide (TPR) repeat protein
MNNPSGNHLVSLTLPSAAKPVLEKIRELIRAGRAAEALPRLSELDGLGRGNPPMLNLTKGTILVDIASDLNDADLARRGVSLIKDVDSARLPEPAQQAYWYNLGNGHSAIYNIKKIPSGVGRALDGDFKRAKQCYRKAMSLRAKSPESSACLYTNYGILLRTVGRHIEEIEEYDKALKAMPDFAMALWHKSKGLCWYSRLVERPTKRSAQLEAWHLLKKSLEVGLEARFKAKALKELGELERILKHPKTPSHRHTEHVADSHIEKKYVKFCLDSRLYLHPCPVTSHEAYQDPLSVRFPTSKRGDYLELRSNPLAFIKQEYIAARFLLFSYRLEEPDLSFVDRGTFLPLVEESKGQIYLQLLILSFRAAYAILDKIAYFLNGFCKLGEKAERIYFREELFLANGALRTELTKDDGPQLSALFDLAHEFSKGQPLYSLRDLRQKLEHRCVPVQRTRTSARGNSPSEDAGSGGKQADDLNENDVYEDAMRLLRVVRATIFYIFYFVRMSVEPPKSEA